MNLLVSHSYAIPHYRALENYFWRYGAEAQICVSRVPDLSNKTEKRKFLSMVDHFAQSQHSIGSDGVQFWLKEMDRYIQYL